jgi:hypothetical protein
MTGPGLNRRTKNTLQAAGHLAYALEETTARPIAGHDAT